MSIIAFDDALRVKIGKAEVKQLSSVGRAPGSEYWIGEEKECKKS